MLSRSTTLVALCLVLVASTAAQVNELIAVNYFTVATEADLLDGGALAEVEIDCMDLINEPGADVFIFYNEATGDLVAYDPNAAPGGRTTIIRSNSQLDADLGGDVTDCRSVTVHDGFIYAVLSVGNVDSVYKTDTSGSSTSVLGEADGTTGIVVDDGVLYLARVEFFGAPEDGFYSMSLTETGQTPTAEATHPDLDLYDIAATAADGIVSSSSKFGVDSFQNVVVRLNLTAGTVEIVNDPFADGVFTNGDDGGLEDIEEDSGCLCGTGHFAFNNSFSAPGGEQFGYFAGPDRRRFAEEAAMLADPDVTISSYDAPDGTHMITSFNNLYAIYIASTSAFGGEDAIIGMIGIPIPVELVSFGAVVDGTIVTLNWATASETNNAGFEVQMRGVDTWDALGWVEGHGTTTEAQTYSFIANGMDVGTHTFRLKQIDFDGAFEYSDELEVSVGTQGTHLISNAYPNPFNPQSQFTLAVAHGQHVLAEMYNTLGQSVAILFEGTVKANQNQLVTIDGADLASGMYIVRVTGERFSDALSVTLLK